MPPIFTIKKREELKIKLLEAGFSMIQELGLKKTTVDRLTKEVGIGKGTFYHFFETKEVFVYEIMVYLRDQFKADFNGRLSARGQLSREEAIQWFQQIGEQKSLYSYLTGADMEWLKKRLPERCFYHPEEDEATIRLLLSHVEGVKDDVNYKLAANFPKIVALAMENRELLHQDVLRENLRMIMGLMYGCIFT